jgi:aldehyde:ferredoxin oxidoreductase
MGERGFTMERLYNHREGFSAKDDRRAKRFTHEEQIPGRKKTVVPLAKMLPRYYRLRGWDENGVPTRRTVKKLDLEFTDAAPECPRVQTGKEIGGLPIADVPARGETGA